MEALLKWDLQGSVRQKSMIVYFAVSQYPESISLEDLIAGILLKIRLWGNKPFVLKSGMKRH